MREALQVGIPERVASGAAPRAWRLAADRPWRLIGAVAVPLWIAMSVAYVAAFTLSVNPEAGVRLLPVEVRVWQQAGLTLLAALAYRAALAVPWPGALPARARAVLAHAGLALLVAMLARPLLLSVLMLFDGGPPVGWTYASTMRDQLTGYGGRLWLATGLETLVRYCFGLTALLVVRTSLALQQAELGRATVTTAWNRARLQALRMQLNPHFLFNALHTIDTVLESHPAQARRLILSVADLFRRALDASDREWATLGEELRFARDYLAIQQARFESRFAYDVRVPEALLDTELPAMLLQPLIENAAIHGVADDRDRLQIDLEVERLPADTGRLRIAIRNVTTGVLPAPSGSGGVGLENVRERLAACFGGTAHLEARAVDERTFLAVVELPTSGRPT